MSASELSSELLSVKDNSLLIAHRIISGPLKIDADHQPTVPITFKVEFRDCEFTDDVVVKKVNFGQSVRFLRVKFDRGLELDSVSVKGDLRLDDVEAGKPILISLSLVEGDLRINSPAASVLQIENLTANNMIVKLGKDPIERLDFIHLRAGRLSLSAQGGTIAKVHQLNLTNVNLSETLVLQNLELQDVTAVSLSVAKRTLFLPVTTISQRLDLSSASLGGFEWIFNKRVELPAKLEMDGATFGNLAIARHLPPEGPASGKETGRVRVDQHDYGLDFLDRAEYYEPAYAAYESSLKTRGQSDKADGVYFAMRDRRRYTEFRDAEGGWAKIVAAFNYVIGFGHKWLFGYGRSWVYPLAWCVVFVLVGTVIFGDADRMQRVDEHSSHVFSPIWYSVDLFVPILSLGVAKNWGPKEGFRLLHFYSKFLSLIGLIFISAMAGALTGTLK